MGWTYTNKESGQSVLEFFKKQWDHEIDCQKVTLLDGAVVNVREFYCVFEVLKKKTNEISRFAMVVLLDYPKDYRFNFGYKEMEDSCGPYYYNCPERILKLLDGYTSKSENAMEWRKICREVLEKKKKRVRLKEGMKISLKNPIRFSDGVSRQIFTYQKEGNRKIFVDQYGTRCKLRDFSKLEYEVVG